jgi:hypothetical protein
MFDHLAHEVHYVSFLFVGFSLSDPNFTLVRDDARLAMGEDMPASYLTQERPDAVVRRYLDSLDVRTIGLESWNALPDSCEPSTPVRYRALWPRLPVRLSRLGISWRHWQVQVPTSRETLERYWHAFELCTNFVPMSCDLT